MESAVPKSNLYKNKWAYGIFEQWQKQRLIKVAHVEVSGLFKDYDFNLVQLLSFHLLHNFGHHYQLPFIYCLQVSLGNYKCTLNLL